MVQITVTEKEWKRVLELVSFDILVKGTVVLHKDFGFYIEIDIFVENDINLYCLVRLPDVSDDEPLTFEYPEIGKVIDSVLIKLSDFQRRIYLSTKPSEFERIKNVVEPPE